MTLPPPLSCDTKRTHRQTHFDVWILIQPKQAPYLVVSRQPAQELPPVLIFLHRQIGRHGKTHRHTRLHAIDTATYLVVARQPAQELPAVLDLVLGPVLVQEAVRYRRLGGVDGHLCVLFEVR